MSTAAVSRHLKVLRERDVVERVDVEGDGRGRAYRLRPDALGGLHRWLADQHWADRLAGTDHRPSVAVLQRRVGEFLDAFAVSDVEFFEIHLADDVTLIFPGMATVLGKADVVDQVRGHAPYTTWNVVGPTSIAALGGGASLLTTRVATATTDRPSVDEVLMTVVFSDPEHGPWQLRHLQQTAVDHPEG